MIRADVIALHTAIQQVRDDGKMSPAQISIGKLNEKEVI
jgi:hypothetical protein